MHQKVMLKRKLEILLKLKNLKTKQKHLILKSKMKLKKLKLVKVMKKLKAKKEH